jgi:hypothetical protein
LADRIIAFLREHREDHQAHQRSRGPALGPFPVVLEAAKKVQERIPAMPKVLQPVAPTWDAMCPGEKMAWLLNAALDVKRDILTMPLPDPDDDSIEAHRARALVLEAADSTIEQTIRLRTNQLTTAANDDGIEKLLEERRQRALLEIERLDAERNDKPPRKH